MVPISWAVGVYVLFGGPIGMIEVNERLGRWQGVTRSDFVANILVLAMSR